MKTFLVDAVERRTFLWLFGLIFFVSCIDAKIDLSPTSFLYQYNDTNTFIWENKLRLEAFYGRNLRMLNDCNNAPGSSLDKVITPGKFTFDTKFTNKYRVVDCPCDLLNVTCGIRMKGVFGSPAAAFKTAPSTIKTIETVGGPHRHSINVHIPIVREIWAEYTLNGLFDIGFNHKHTFTMGLFPFKLGRGIALGDAYAVTPDVLGYDPEIAVEQYAPGFKFAGSLADDKLCDYDAYVEIVSNRSDTFDNVNEKVRGQQYGQRYDQARGYGVVNFILAGRLKSTLCDSKNLKIYLEPYALLDEEREQRVNLTADANTKLGTFGVAGEVTMGDFEWGFDTALNIGRQHVLGIDRNVINLVQYEFTDAAKNITSVALTQINSKVTAYDDDPQTGDQAGRQALYNLKYNQPALDEATALSTPWSNLHPLNGAIYEKSDGKRLQNAIDRYRNAYNNMFSGFMFVWDASYRLRPNLKLAVTLGYATGDENPNGDLDTPNDSAEDGDYGGFISLQELYYGVRVRSSFMLSGKGSVPRILSIPLNRNVAGGIPSNVSRFTNLIYTGGAVWWDKETECQLFKINPNILFFWQQHPSRIRVVENRDVYASTFLGTEMNLWVDALLSRGLTGFLVSGFFLPGQHYKDITGQGLSRAEIRFLDQRDRTGVVVDREPTVGHDPAFFINAGFEYKF